MPQLPHLPPVAQAIAVIVGVALAVTRLLTASKAFWWRFPEWLQKAAPAALVAIGLLPAALEQAQSWLDVAQALLLSVGAWFTASRGDQRPVEPPSKPSDPDATTRIIPPPTPFFPSDRSRLHNDSPDEPAEMRGLWAMSIGMRAALTLSVFTLVFLGCSAAAKKLPCDESRLRAIDAAYLAEVGKHCLQYASAAECPELPELRAKHSADLKAACPQ